MNRETLAKANLLIKKINALKAFLGKMRQINGDSEFSIKCTDIRTRKEEWVEVPEEVMDYLETFVEEMHKKLSKEFEEL